ncbi:mechanosensitive ion channel family protein [Stappia stellulata]|uniref:mechanosensitive ion channel family protein n=1 Tax=Stappia stellulata TaxID=71235 RepID=UPI0003F94A3B|nr:mechanosensitive ion channel family protein [Stappia stellulata]
MHIPDRISNALPAGVLRRLRITLALILISTLPGFAQDGNTFWYEADRLNSGLSDRSEERVRRSTPRQTLRSFLAATDRGDFATAAHCLNLSRLDPDRQSRLGPEAARKLSEIIARQVWIDWSSLSARPDARIEQTGKAGSRAGDPRRDIHLATLQTDGLAFDLRIARFKAPGEPAAWLFTPQTVENIAPLYKAFGPRPYEAYVPAVLKKEFAGLWLWEWIALPLLAIGILLLGWGIRSLVSRLAMRAKRGWLKSGLDKSAQPLSILVMAGAGQVLLSLVFSFSGPTQALLHPTLIILMVWGVGMTLLRLIDALLHRVTLRYVGEIDDRRGRDEREFYTSIYALRRLILLVMVTIAALLVLDRLNLFDNIGMTLLASAGVLTVVFGIAGQAVLGNILASLQIALAKPVRIGDAILYEGKWAYVEAIFYTFLRLRTWDHRRIVVPVTYFIARPFENWSVSEARMIWVIDLWLDPRADVDVLRSKFGELLQEDTDVTEPDNAYTYVTDQTTDGLKLSFYAMMPDPSTGWAAQSRLREKLLAFIRDDHPDWLPRDRILDVGRTENDGATRASHAADPG